MLRAIFFASILPVLAVGFMEGYTGRQFNLPFHEFIVVIACILCSSTLTYVMGSRWVYEALIRRLPMVEQCETMDIPDPDYRAEKRTLVRQAVVLICTQFLLMFTPIYLIHAWEYTPTTAFIISSVVAGVLSHAVGIIYYMASIEILTQRQYRTTAYVNRTIEHVQAILFVVQIVFNSYALASY